MTNKKTLRVGITGGIGSGKSTICKIFQILGIPIYEADNRAKWLMTHHLDLMKAVKQAFGEDAYLPDGQLNRSYLASQVFHDENKRQFLNQLVHPYVGEDFRNWATTQDDKPYLLNEAALMFESGRYQDLDKVITVFAPENIRIQRVMKRDPQRSIAEIEAIMQKQMPEEEKLEKADFVVYNDDVQLVIPQILTLHKKLLNI
jgi:dephospho-CoA kinase